MKASMLLEISCTYMAVQETWELPFTPFIITEEQVSCNKAEHELL